MKSYLPSKACAGDEHFIPTLCLRPSSVQSRTNSLEHERCLWCFARISKHLHDALSALQAATLRLYSSAFVSSTLSPSFKADAPVICFQGVRQLQTWHAAAITLCLDWCLMCFGCVCCDENRPGIRFLLRLQPTAMRTLSACAEAPVTINADKHILKLGDTSHTCGLINL